MLSASSVRSPSLGEVRAQMTPVPGERGMRKGSHIAFLGLHCDQMTLTEGHAAVQTPGG